MEQNQNHWIALYLSGQYPGKYILPDKINILLKIRQIDSVNFNDTIVSMLQGKSDVEYFNTLLETFLTQHGEEEYNKLLEVLKIPDEVKNNPNKLEERISGGLDIQKLTEYISSLDEEKFSRYIVTPLLEAMGYEDIEFKGKVTETDNGLDYYPVKYYSPGGLMHYAGIQVKAKKITSGDTGTNELGKLINETKSAFGQEHCTRDGNRIYISEYVVLNSKEIIQSANDKYFANKDVKDRKIKLYGRDGILSLIREYELNINIG